MAYVNPYFNNLPWWGSQPRQFGVSEFPQWGSENIGGFGDSGGPETDWTQPRQGMNTGQLNQGFAGVTSGLSAGQAFGNPNQFSMSQGGIMGGVASGAASGAAAGPLGAGVGAVVGGVTSFFKQDAQLKKNINNVNTDFNSMTDIYGRPVFDSTGFAQGTSDLQGLMEATVPGKHAMRPRRRRQAERKLNELHNSIMTGQQNFNQAETKFRDRMTQLSEFNERVNDNSRLQNLYRFQ